MALGFVDGRKLGCTVGPSTCKLLSCGVSNGETEGFVVGGSCIGTAVSDTTGETGGCTVSGSCIGTAVSDATGETGGCIVWGSTVSLGAVGRDVGNSIGKTEGSAFWGTVGLFVGGLVGVNDGREVAIVCAVAGTVVGLLLGKMLGCLEEKVWPSVGREDGLDDNGLCMLGAAVGEGLGIGVGCELGKCNSGDCVGSEDGLPVGL
jgi:hypothetical protein